jgi:hypothetical protein
MDKRLLLAIAIAVGLVLIVYTIMGFSGPTVKDAPGGKASYWKAGHPFAILSHSIDSAGNATFVMQNMEQAPNTLKGIVITDSRTWRSSSTELNETLYPGEIKEIHLNGISGVQGDVYEIRVDINYSDFKGTDRVQSGGANTLTGRSLLAPSDRYAFTNIPSWKVARPIAILNHSIDSASGNVTFALQSLYPLNNLTLTSIAFVDNATGRSSATLLNVALAPGEIRKITVVGVETEQDIYGLVIELNGTGYEHVKNFTEYGNASALLVTLEKKY